MCAVAAGECGRAGFPAVQNAERHGVVRGYREQLQRDEAESSLLSERPFVERQRFSGDRVNVAWLDGHVSSQGGQEMAQSPSHLRSVLTSAGTPISYY